MIRIVTVGLLLPINDVALAPGYPQASQLVTGSETTTEGGEMAGRSKQSLCCCARNGPFESAKQALATDKS